MACWRVAIKGLGNASFIMKTDYKFQFFESFESHDWLRGLVVEERIVILKTDGSFKRESAKWTYGNLDQPTERHQVLAKKVLVDEEIAVFVEGVRGAGFALRV